jgi:hypothetical protein
MSVADIKKRTLLGERIIQGAVIALAKAGELEVEYQKGPRGCNRYRILTTPANFAPPQTLRGAESAPPQDLRPQESPQDNPQDPANFAPPAESAPPQDPAEDPANFADKPHKEPKNSPTESSKGGVGEQDSALFGEDTPKPKRTRGRAPRPTLGPEFDEWYAAYPVHKARGDAEKAWVQVVREGADPQVLIAAAKRYRDDPQVTRGYGKFPAGWLRAKCWLDETTAPPPAAASQNGGKQTNYTDEEYAGGWS